MHQKTVVEKAIKYCCCATYRAIGLDEKCGICELVDAFIRLDDQRADMWRIVHTVKINSDGAMSLTESLHALVSLLGETNEALAACQSQASGILRSIRGDIEAAYNGLDYLTSIHVATAADPNGGRQLAIDAAEIKGRLLQHIKRIDAVVTTVTVPDGAA